MAINRGLFPLEGTINNVTFRNTKDGNVASKKSRLNKKRIMEDPAFAATRQNMNEFRFCSKEAKKMRDAFRCLLKGISCRELTNNMMRLFKNSLRYDTVNEPGKRKPHVSLATPQGKEMLKGFNFNYKTPLNRLFPKPITTVSLTGEIQLGNVTPITDLECPAEATHVKFSGAVVMVNLQNGVYDQQLTNEVLLAINTSTTTVNLTPTAVPTGTGIKLYLVRIEFYKLINSTYVQLQDRSHKAMEIVDIE